MMRPPARLFAIALIAIASLAACKSAPPPRPVVVAPPGVELPLTAQVLFEVAPNQRDFNVSSFGPYVWSYREAPLMHAAAMEMMRDMFSVVQPSDGPTQNGVVVQISGYTSINPGVSSYYATALADVFVRTDAGERQIGQYRGRGNAWGRIYSYPPLQTAWAQAFSDLSQQMLADPELMKRFAAKGRK